MLDGSQVVAFVATTDLDRARAFYEVRLGLTVLDANPGAVVLDAGGAMLRITQVDQVSVAPYTVLGWTVTDMEASVDVLVAAGVTFRRFDGMEQDHRGIWTAPGGDLVAWFSDVDGNLLSLSRHTADAVADRHFVTSRVAMPHETSPEASGSRQRGRRRRLVDYERAASHYDRGRSLPDGSRRRWSDAIRERLPDGPLRRVVDVGAGTGVFLDLWGELGAASVVAVEPSVAMRTRAAAREVDGVHVVAGSAEDLPLASGCADVLWLSAVIHHVVDLDAAAGELRRALRPDGCVLVRGFVPDRSRVPWLDHLPGADRAATRFPTSDVLTAAFDRVGFVTVEWVEVDEPARPRAGEAAAWIEEMRVADSILIALDDDEIAAGVAALRERPDEELVPLALTLMRAVAGRGGSTT